MTFANKAELTVEIDKRLRRPDQLDRTPGYIRLAEAELNREVRANRKILRTNASVTSEFVGVPSDFGGARSMALTSGNRTEIRYISPEQIALLKDDRASAATGSPQYYSVVGDEFEFYPAPAATYPTQLTYYRKLDALVGDEDTNWLLDDHPDVYLSGALYHGFAYLKNVEAATLHKGLFDAGILSINAASLAEAQGGVLQPCSSMRVV